MTDKKTKVSSKKTVHPAARNIVQIKQESGKSKDRQFAEIALSPVNANTMTAIYFLRGNFGNEIDITESLKVMGDKVAKVNAGAINELEATLTAQVVSLDAIFNEMARRAADNMGTYLQATESYMRLALKSQAQCARAIEVLATMKNPPVVFAKQANISNGNQQVNNGSVTNGQVRAHAGKNINQSNELLSENNNEAMDTSRTTTTSRKDKAVETVGAVNWGSND